MTFLEMLQNRKPQPLKLPEILPGTPPSGKVQLDVCIVRDTPKALQLEMSDNMDATFWLPKSIAGTPRKLHRYTHAEVFRVEVAVWFYLRLLEEHR